MTLQSVRARRAGSIGVVAPSLRVLSALVVALLASAPAAAATLDSITVAPADSTLRQGQVVRFVATGHYSDGTTADVSADAAWASSSPAVAWVHNPSRPDLSHIKGIVTAVAVGRTTITAHLGGVTGRTQVTVIDTDIVSITTKPTSKNLEVGLTSQFKAKALYLDDSDDDVTDEVEWFSSDPSVASVSNTLPTKGLVTPLKPGTVTITARDPQSGIQSTDGAATVRARATHIAFDPLEVTTGKKLKYPLRVYVHRADGTRNQITEDVEFSVVPADVIRVGTGDNAGIVTPLKNGVARVSAFDQKRAMSTDDSGHDATVAVSGKVLELHVEPDPTRMAVDEEKNARAFALLSSGKKSSDLRRIVEWSVADPTIATVGTTPADNGELVGKKSGVTTLRAFYAPLGLQSPETDNLQVLGQLQSLALEAGDGLFPMNEEIEVKARGTYEGAIKLNVTDRCTWVTINPNIAVVDDAEDDGDGKGWVRGLKLGTTTLRATCEGKQVQQTIRVIGTLTGLTVDPASYAAEALEEKQFRAIGQYSDGQTKDLTKLASWTSSNTAVASIDNLDDRGTVTAIGTGSSTITASKPPFVASGVVTVGAGIVRIEVLPDGQIVRGSEDFRMRARGIRADNEVTLITNRVVWSSANTQIARVSNLEGEKGRVFGGGVEGTTEITATLPGTDLSDAASVTTSCLLDSMRFDPTTKSWPMGRAKRAKVIGEYNCPSRSTRNISANVMYVSSNPNVVVVSNGPKVPQVMTPVAPGTATITAIDPSSGKSASNSLHVTILP
ncbi:MAG: Ig-like domain-containing protein [Thermodesulfobacteriota bacterium]